MARDPILTLHAHLPKRPFQMFDVWLMHRVQPVLHDELDDSEESLPYVNSQRIKLAFNSPVQNLDLPDHKPTI